MTEKQEPNVLIISKACLLWVEMLSNPKFDALGGHGDRDDPNGSVFLSQGMAAVLAEKNKPTAEALSKFAEELKKYLINKTTYIPETQKIVLDSEGCYRTSLSVDYHPDFTLGQAAENAGVSTDSFPWKTSMYLMGDHLSLSYGYGGETLRYYPIDGQWLITTLCGSDISKVFEYIRGGSPVFDIQT